MKIQINQLVKSYAGDILLNNLSLEIIKGSKSAIVGENGSGKTSLLKIIAGIENYQEGTRIVPKEMSAGYMLQVYPDFAGSGREFILSAFEDYRSLSHKLRELEAEMSTASVLEAVFEKYTRTLEYFEHAGGYALENNLEAYAKGLGVFEVLSQPFNALSGGQKTRMALVQLLLQDHEVLCLDEPTNHLDTQGIEWLERFCQTSAKTLVIVSHDRQFLINTVSVFHEIQDGQIVTYYGSYDSYRQQRHERFLNLVNDFGEQQKEIQKLKLAIRRYRQWGNESNNEDFFKRAKALEKRLERIEKLPKPIEIKNQLKWEINRTHLGSRDVVIADRAVIGYTKPLTEALSFVVRRQERFAIAGKNGKGKTSLLKTLMNEIRPLSGTLRFGIGVEVGYLPQVLHFENQKERILQTVMRSCNLDEEKARRYLAGSGFYQSDLYKSIHQLSGGEQVRLKLLEMMIKGCNCLVLDEPTNHLDIHSCEIIEDALRKFEGTVIIISHDRLLLKRLNARLLFLT